MNPIKLNVVQTAMVKEFQCPGCMSGPEPSKCPNFKPTDSHDGCACEGWRPGTNVIPGGLIALGLPVGFNKIGPMLGGDLSRHGYIGLFDSPDKANVPVAWNYLNLPVWAMEKDGFLFVKTYSPRRNLVWVAVIKGGTMALFDKCPTVPRPLDVGEFVEQID